MKAWLVEIEEGVFLIHGETRGKAITTAQRYTDLGDFDYDFIDIRARRCKKLDDKPLSLENAELAICFPDSIDEDGKPYEGEYLTREEYRNNCPCSVCSA